MRGTPKTITEFLGLNSPDPITLISERIRKTRTLGGLIEILSSIPRPLFTDDRHHEYYKAYVIPKLRLVGRSYIQRHPRKEWRAYRHSFGLEVMLSNSYIVLGIMRIMEDLREVDESFTTTGDKVVRWYTYLLGLNSDGKLFVNRVPTALVGTHGNLVSYLGVAEVREVEDREIMMVLGFDRSMDSLEEVTISHEGNYRVQGEVVMAVNQFWTGTAESIEDYYRRMATAMSEEIRNYVRYLAYDRVMVELLMMGFSARFNERVHGGEIRIVDATYYGDDGDRKAAAVAVALCKRLGGIVYNSGVCSCDIEDRLLGRFSVVVDTDRIPYGERYGDITLRVYTHGESRATLELAREFEERVRSMPRGMFRLMFGNHVIEVENAYSTSITYTPSMQPLALPPRVLSTTGTAFYVDSESKVRITHQDHGTITIRFARPFMISFTATNTDETYPGEVNRLILKMLMRKHQGEIMGLARGYVDPYTPHLPVGTNG